MKTTLIIMAAGLGTRYGGSKQIDRLGPNGEILAEYAARDAVSAGFDRIVFVIREGMEPALRELCGDRLSRIADVRYAAQSFESLPGGFTPPADRAKPYGTVHAVLSAREIADGPFAVVNADDYYGPDAYRLMHGFLTSDCSPRDAAMIAYRLRNTVSPNGSVTRGVCITENGCLTSIEEIKSVSVFPDGSILNTSGETGAPLDGDSPVSMNFWGFHPAFFNMAQTAFESFLARLAEGDMRSEYPLPVMIDRLIRRDELRVHVLETDEAWFGVTYAQDKAEVSRRLQARG